MFDKYLHLYQNKLSSKELLRVILFFHILDFTKEVKNKREEEKKIVIEALWNIIYSDENADIYETNLMRRLTGLLYLDNKVMGDIKEKVKNKIKK